MNYTDQLAAIIAEIAPVLKDGLDAANYAAAMLETADDDESYFEVRGSHTKSGTPHAFTIA